MFVEHPAVVGSPDVHGDGAPVLKKKRESVSKVATGSTKSSTHVGVVKSFAVFFDPLHDPFVSRFRDVLSVKVAWNVRGVPLKP